VQQPDSGNRNGFDTEHADDMRQNVSLKREVLDRLDPTSAHEGVLPSVRGLMIAVVILTAFFWTASVAILIFYEHILDQAEKSWGTFFMTFPPILFVTIGVVALLWWISRLFASWNSWGRANIGVARWFWMLSLTLLLFFYIDPLNRIHFMMTDFPMIGIVNLGYLAIYVFAYCLLVALFWDNFVYGAKRALFHLERWHDMFVSILLGMKIVGIHFVRPVITELYPEERPEIAPTFRGRHMLAFDESGAHLCISCKACEKICPDRLIVIESVRNPETKKLVLTGFILDNSRCSFCGLCEDVCPTGAIRHTTEYSYSALSRDDLVLDILGEYFEKTKNFKKDTGDEK
jgi:NADH-quinone oxidoreductase subunit I